MQAIRKLTSQSKVQNFNKFFRSIYCNVNAVKINNSRPVLRITMVTDLFVLRASRKAAICENRLSYSTATAESDLVDSVTFEKVCEETLDSLCDYFEVLVEGSSHLSNADVSYGSGVLTVNFGKQYGTYVINRQSPNRQIWLSSPTSGPKRYDFVSDGEFWVYKHDGQTLHQLLQNEIAVIVKSSVDFSTCSHSRL